MTHEDQCKEAQQYLLRFLNSIKHFECDATGSVLTTMCQFIENVREIFVELADAQDNTITIQQILQTQIDVLRKCVIDLQYVLNDKETKQ